MGKRYKLGILATHPIQYYAPWYQALAARPELDVTVYFAHRQTASGQANAGFGVGFEWDVPLLEGYRHEFLKNISAEPGKSFRGCDTPAILDRIRDERFDAFLVHGWGVRSYWQAMRACWRSGTPVMVRGDSQLLTPRSKLKKLIKSVTYPRFIRRFDGYLVVGQRAREYYLAYGADPARMHFCPHFVDNDRFSTAAEQLRPRRSQLREQLGISDDALCLLFCGKFIGKKRPLDLIQAATDAIVRSKTRRPIHLLFVGSGELGDEMRRNCRVVTDAERSSAVGSVPTTAIDDASKPLASFAGFLNQSAIPAAYVAADMLVLPSDGGETWGLVVNEAMACGTAAVVSDQVGCAPDLVIDDHTGYTFPCGQTDSLTTVIERLGERSDLTEALGTRARAHVAAYSIAAAADATVKAVGRLVSLRSSAAEALA